MKRILSMGMALICIISSHAQQSPQKVYYAKAKKFFISKPLRDLPIATQSIKSEKREIENKLRRNEHVNPNALPVGEDPIWQKTQGTKAAAPPIQNWEGIQTSAFPPDPSGAAGPNHYVQMVNTKYAIYDKSGNLMGGPYDLNTLLGTSNDGDPIVLYDKFADRWFLSQFQDISNEIVIGISQTSDPLGQYYIYTFQFSNFPDYPKYAIWVDGYYMTANMGQQNAVAFERDKMLAGDPGAQMVALTFPSLYTNGFFSALPADVDGNTLPPLGTPEYFFYFNDDGWGQYPQDAIRVYQMTVDWNNPNNSSLVLSQTIPVSPFDSEFTSSWNDIEQPGTSQRLDAIPGAIMYRAQYRSWGTYNTVVLNHTVDVDNTDHAGIRWYELRDANDGNFSVYQEGTYAPDAESRWLGSISMDAQGNIGLAYSVSGPTVYPSIRYTGRYASDPLGQMTLAEETIVTGTTAQTSVNRWGDYAQMTVDPTDDLTFWYTGEYHSGSQRTRIASFKIASDFQNDVGVTDLITPVTGVLSASESIQITIRNFGTQAQTSIPVGYSINGGTPVMETYNSTIPAGGVVNYTFSTTADFSTPGTYQLKLFTALATDQFNTNDTLSTSVIHLYTDDAGVTSVINPVSGSGLTANESIQVVIKNYGGNTINNIPVAYSINGGTPVTESYAGSISSGGTANYTFTTTADLSALGTYTIKAYTAYPSDPDNTNDTTTVSVIHQSCIPTANCNFGDGFVNFELNTIQNASSCGSNGYEDFTSISTDLQVGGSYPLFVESGYDQQILSVWIDFNDDGTFDDNTEKVILAENSGANTYINTTLTIPATAPLGSHVLRARSIWQNAATDACSDENYGETEDYMVNIVDTTLLATSSLNDPYVNVFMNNNTQELVVNVKNINHSGQGTAIIYNNIGQEVKQISNLQSGQNLINISELSPGSYLVKLKIGNITKTKKIIKL